MEQIYLDREQCRNFDTEYFESDDTVIRANILLESKDYDKSHTTFLSSLGNNLLKISRKREDPPGWYIPQVLLYES
jgi:hypothetical protein